MVTRQAVVEFIALSKADVQSILTTTDSRVQIFIKGVQSREEIQAAFQTVKKGCTFRRILGHGGSLAMRRTFTAIFFMLGLAGLANAQYNPYFSDQLTTSNSGNWQQNGSLTYGSSGITSSSAGAVVSKVTVPTYPNDYLVEANVILTANTNGGNFGVMARASSNALSNPATGSFYMLELQSPTWSGRYACSATLAMIKVVSGVWSTLLFRRDVVQRKRTTNPPHRSASHHAGVNCATSDSLRRSMPGRTSARYSSTGARNRRQDSTTDMIAATFGPACLLPT